MSAINKLKTSKKNIGNPRETLLGIKKSKHWFGFKTWLRAALAVTLIPFAVFQAHSASATAVINTEEFERPYVTAFNSVCLSGEGKSALQGFSEIMGQLTPDQLEVLRGIKLDSQKSEAVKKIVAHFQEQDLSKSSLSEACAKIYISSLAGNHYADGGTLIMVGATLVILFIIAKVLEVDKIYYNSVWYSPGSQPARQRFGRE